jgi:LPS export ABC transporter protein LptC
MRYFLAILSIVVLLSCTEKDDKKKHIINISDTTNQPDQVSQNVRVAFNDSSYKKAVLVADKTRIYTSNAETFLDGHLKVEFFSKETGLRASVLTADSARIDDKTKNMHSWGHVLVIADSSNTRLESEELNWDQATKKFFSQKFVKITSPTELIQGSGFESDQNLKNYKIYKSSGEKK